MRKILGLFVLLVCSGCATRIVDFTLISTKNVDWSNAARFEKGKERVEGTDEGKIIIIFSAKVPSVKEAIDRAIEKVPGAIALVDGVLTQKLWYIPGIFGKGTYVIEGTPLIDPQLAATQLENNFMVAKIDSKGEVKEFKFLNKKEYIQVRNKYLADNL